MPNLMKSHSVISDMKYAHKHIVGHELPNMLQYPEIILGEHMSLCVRNMSQCYSKDAQGFVIQRSR
jgi:hypothetical protein